jgi:hypothetical protein
MARIHGRNGVVYLGLTNGAAASPMAFLSDWTINRTVAKVDVTAMGDANKVYVAGIPDAAGDFTGWYDDATPQMYAATVDGLSRNFYLYESVLSPANYWFGQVLPDMSVTAGVGAGVQVKSAWNAAGPVQRSRAGVIG